MVPFLNLSHSQFQCGFSLLQFFCQVVIFHHLCLGCALVMYPLTLQLLHVRNQSSVRTLQLRCSLLVFVNNVGKFGNLTNTLLYLNVKVIVCVFVVFYLLL
jgi:hypothetical protein